MRFLASDVAAATGGTLIGPDVPIEGVSFDSRSIAADELFVPIVAERDGHDFIGLALKVGAAAYLTQQPSVGGSAIAVDDTGAALLALGSWGRAQLQATVIAITGSVGKTSTKDLARAALSAGLCTTANEKSFNNDQGLPVTILNAPGDTQALVLEMGMRGFGEIKRLCDVGRPTIGVITRIAAAHTELLGGIEGVAKAKAELIQALPAAGTAILNGDDPYASAMAADALCPVLTFGVAPRCDVQVADLRLDGLARPRFTLLSPWGDVEVTLGVSGQHMAMNAAAALAVAGVCGVDLGSAVAALGGAALSPWRMEIGHTASGALVINDAYNANPASMRAAIESLLAVEITGRRVCVLGVMAELADPASDHAEIAALLEANGVELIAVGTDQYGVGATTDPLALLRTLTSADAILVKGSRVAGLEKLVAALFE